MLAQKRLRGRLGEVDWILVQHEVVQCAVLSSASGTEKNLVRKLVPGLVGFHRIADPVIEGPHRCGIQPAAGDEQQVRPLVCPIIEKLLALKQPIDEFFDYWAYK